MADDTVFFQVGETGSQIYKLFNYFNTGSAICQAFDWAKAVVSQVASPVCSLFSTLMSPLSFHTYAPFTFLIQRKVVPFPALGMVLIRVSTPAHDNP